MLLAFFGAELVTPVFDRADFTTLCIQDHLILIQLINPDRETDPAVGGGAPVLSGILKPISESAIGFCQGHGCHQSL